MRHALLVAVLLGGLAVDVQAKAQIYWDGYCSQQDFANLNDTLMADGLSAMQQEFMNECPGVYFWWEFAAVATGLYGATNEGNNFTYAEVVLWWHYWLGVYSNAWPG